MLSGRLVNERLQARADLSREVDWCAVVTGALKDLVAGFAAVEIRQMARIISDTSLWTSTQLLARSLVQTKQFGFSRNFSTPRAAGEVICVKTRPRRDVCALRIRNLISRAHT